MMLFLCRNHLSSLFPNPTPWFDLSQPKIIFSDIKAGNINALDDQHLRYIDQKAFHLKYEGSSIRELAKILSSKAKTETEKARIIYTWITNNIAYDVGMSLNNIDLVDVNPATVLKERKTICSGYANLYQALAQEMGLDVVIIEGTATGSSYIVGDTAINHAWNAVKIQDQWYLLDATWGAGTVTETQFRKKFNPYYFATPPEQFIFNHFPADSAWQLLANPYTRENFEDLPDVSPGFFQKNIDLVSHRKREIKMGNQSQIILSVPQKTTVVTALKKNNQNIPDHYNLVQKEGKTVTIQSTFPELGKYKLDIFANSTQSQDYVHILTYQITATSINSPFPKTSIKFQENEGYLYTPLTYQLPNHKMVEFKLKVQNAIDIQVLNTETNEWTQLTRLDDLFMEKLKVGDSPVKVVAQFPGDPRYWTLVEYN
ncbi:MAG: transglutaminase [Cyanobacteria bacterium]|jgi:transglutaminase/protease-like cytokinesis protein 3|nr:transglutaminase [Cyanobacteria bacterium GSL.Bin1]